MSKKKKNQARRPRNASQKPTGQRGGLPVFQQDGVAELVNLTATEEDVVKLMALWDNREHVRKIAPSEEAYTALLYAIAWNDNTPESVILSMGDEIAAGRIDADEELNRLVQRRAADFATGRAVADYDIQIISVAGDDRRQPWAYSVGLRAHGLPELTLLGSFAPELVGYLFNTIAKRLIAGEAFEPDTNIPGLIKEPYFIQLGPEVMEEVPGYPLTLANARNGEGSWRAIRIPEKNGGFYPELGRSNESAFRKL